MRKYALAGGLAAVAIVLDLLTKNYILATYEFGSYVPVTSYFNLVHVHNPGAAFGFLARAPESTRLPFFLGISVAAVGIIGWLVYKAAAGKIAYVSGLGLVLGGAVGNFIDRIRFGYVIDFLDFFVGTSHWPAFNVADIAISVGVGLLILDMIGEERAERAGRAAASK
jgi:signal peptidase II